MNKFIAAAIQIDSQGDKKENLDKLDHYIDVAKKYFSANLIGLAEMVNFSGKEKDFTENAESIPGPTTDFFSKKAKQHKIWLNCGSIPEKIPSEKKSSNTSIFINPEGEIVSIYRKIHLFDIDLPGMVTAFESDFIKAGNEIVIADSELGKIGLTICYDLRFPELFRALTLRGAKIIFVPSEFAMNTGRDHWECLLRARAIENEVYVIAPDQVGKKPIFQSYGRSLIIDPWGTVIAKASDRECVIAAEIDLEYLEKIRRGLPCLQHRRPDIYPKE